MRGTNAGLMKENNKCLILRMIRRGGYSRAGLAKETGLTKATISLLTDELMQSGLIFDEPAQDTAGVGRNPLILKLCESSRCVIGIGLSRNDYQLGLFDLGGNCLEMETKSYLHGDAQLNAQNIAEQIEKYRGMLPDRNIIGIGIASPGPVNYKTGTILNPPDFSKWHNFNICEYLFKKTNLPCVLERDSYAYAMAEQYFGCCQTEDNFAYVVIDEGIGAGVVINNKFYRGSQGRGCELGHITLIPNGKPCTCGNNGCLECYASIPALIKGTKYSSWREIIDANDTKIIEKEAEYMSDALVNLINLFDLETVVLGGGIIYGGHRLANIIQSQVKSRTIVNHPVRVTISASEKSKALAGASTAMHNLFFRPLDKSLYQPADTRF